MNWAAWGLCRRSAGVNGRHPAPSRSTVRLRVCLCSEKGWSLPEAMLDAQRNSGITESEDKWLSDTLICVTAAACVLGLKAVGSSVTTKQGADETVTPPTITGI